MVWILLVFALLVVILSFFLQRKNCIAEFVWFVIATPFQLIKKMPLLLWFGTCIIVIGGLGLIIEIAKAVLNGNFRFSMFLSYDTGTTMLVLSLSIIGSVICDIFFAVSRGSQSLNQTQSCGLFGISIILLVSAFITMAFRPTNGCSHVPWVIYVMSLVLCLETNANDSKFDKCKGEDTQIKLQNS